MEERGDELHTWASVSAGGEVTSKTFARTKIGLNDIDGQSPTFRT